MIYHDPWQETQNKYIKGDTDRRRGFYDFNIERTDSKKRKEKIKSVSVCKSEVISRCFWLN